MTGKATTMNVSALFLLAVTVSVIAMSTAYLQEIQIDIVPNVDSHDTDDSSIISRHDRDNAVWPPHQNPARQRQRRMLTDVDRQRVVDTLNRLRRSLGAPNMYYVTWDIELEKRAANLTSSCQLREKAQMSLSARYASGLTGYTQPSDIAGEIQKIYCNGPDNNNFYWQIMSSHLVYVGCAVDARPCDGGILNRRRGHVFTCLFTYNR